MQLRDQVSAEWSINPHQFHGGPVDVAWIGIHAGSVEVEATGPNMEWNGMELIQRPGVGTPYPFRQK